MKVKVLLSQSSVPPEQPHLIYLREWQKESLAAIRAGARAGTKTWWNELHLRPHQIEFAIVVPVRNEEQSLEAHLNALSVSMIPHRSRTLLILVVNGTNDRSEQVARKFLADLYGPPSTSKSAKLTSKDPRAHVEFFGGKSNSAVLVTTPTASKPHALKLASILALQNGFKILMNIDGDVFPQPDTLARLHAKCVEVKLGAGGTPLVFGANSYSLRIPEKTIFERAKNKFFGLNIDPKHRERPFAGSCTAFDPIWFLEHVPEIKADDAAMRLMCETTHGQPALCDALVHALPARTLRDALGQSVRSRCGYLQLERYARHHPQRDELLQRSRSLRLLSMPLKSQISSICKDVRSFRGFTIAATKILGVLLVDALAAYSFSRNPEQSSWISPPSSKLPLYGPTSRQHS